MRKETLKKVKATDTVIVRQNRKNKLIRMGMKGM